jgi:hypothetical protein
MAENKISQEHLEELQKSVSDINQVALQIGNLELQKHALLHQGVELQGDLQKFQTKLEDKYGKVSINIQDGSYKPIEEEKVTEPELVEAE